MDWGSLFWSQLPECERGLDALASYHVRRESGTGIAQDIPVHDWSSHAADALRMLAEAEMAGLLEGGGGEMVRKAKRRGGLVVLREAGYFFMKRGKIGVRAGAYQKRRRKKKKKGKAARQLLLLRLCAVPKCGKLALKKARLCSACRMRLQVDPFRRLWVMLKVSAKKRGKVFALSWEHFQEVAVAGGYDKGHGRGPDGLQVDRIDPRRGYEDGNIQILTGRQNAQKAAAERKGWLPGDPLPFDLGKENLAKGGE